MNHPSLSGNLSKSEQEVFDLAVSGACFTFDVEHSPEVRPHQEGFCLWGASFCVGDKVVYITDNDTIKHMFVSLVKAGSIPIAHNAKYDLKCMRALGVSVEDMPETCYCTMVAVNLLEDYRHYNKLGLKLLVWEKYQHQMMTFDEASAHGKDSPEFFTYATEDSLYTWKLWRDFLPELERQGLWPVYTKILGPASILVADIELKGIHWDSVEGRKQAAKIQQVAEETEHTAKEWVGYDVNLNSPVQLSKRIFKDLGLPTEGIKRGKNGNYSTDEKSLKILAKKNPGAAALRANRTAIKQLNTYMNPTCELADSDDESRVHANFWLTSSTGRTRSDDPNLQNFTARWGKEIEKWFKDISVLRCFSAPKGKKLICADYSQLELRLIAHITQDPFLLNAYLKWSCSVCGESGKSKELLRKCPNCGCDTELPPDKQEKKGVKAFYHGADLHGDTARRIEVLKGNRDEAKTINFSVVYRAQPQTLHSRNPKLSKRAWSQAIDYWFEMCPKVERWHNICEAQMVAGRPSKCLFGRLRRFTKDDLKKKFNHCLNQYVNFPPQASGSHLTLLAATKVRKKLMEKGYWPERACIVNLVHDAIITESDEDIAEEVAEVVRHESENAVKFAVPIRLDYSIVDNWAEGK